MTKKITGFGGFGFYLSVWNAIFFGTAGRGIDTFVVEELKSFHCSQIHQTDGKVYWSYDDTDVTNLLKLRSVERLFVQIDSTENYRWKGYKKFKALMNRITTWQEAYHLYKQFSDMESSEPVNKKLRPDNKAPVTSSCLVTFRVSSKIYSDARCIDCKEVSSIVAKVLNHRFGWCSNLKSPQFEISLHMNMNSLTIGIPVTKKPLSCRPYMQTFGLRSTVAWVLVHLAQINKNQVVLDPMCGTAAVLMEAVHCHKDISCLGCDNSTIQLRRAQSNVRDLPIDLLHTDVTNLPFPHSCIDRVICDIPFGQLHGSDVDIKSLYRNIVTNINRVMKFNGICVLLTSCALKEYLLQQVKLLTSQQFPDSESLPHKSRTITPWTILNTHDMKLGETHSVACVFRKDS